MVSALIQVMHANLGGEAGSGSPDLESTLNQGPIKTRTENGNPAHPKL